MLNKTKDREHVKLEEVQPDTSDENGDKKRLLRHYSSNQTPNIYTEMAHVCDRRIANSNYWTGTKASPKKCIK